MNKFSLLIICLFPFVLLFGQEDPSVTKKLKDKYGYVYYNDMGEDECYVVGKEPHVGACDKNGKEIVPPKYDFATKMGKIYLTTKNRKSGAYNLKGKEIISPKFYAVVEYLEFCTVYDDSIGKKDTHKGLYDLEGNMILPCEYERIEYDNDHHIFPRKDHLYGCIDKKGKILLKCEYTSITIYDSL